MGTLCGLAVCDEFVKQLFRCSIFGPRLLLHLGFESLSNHESYLA